LLLRLSAQLPQGSVAPDFTAQDVGGQNWHLYELLEQGKIVVLEVGATWCPPCWAYHNNHAMQQLYEAHGPQGDDKLQVFFVEGDPGTNVECLFGQDDCDEFTPGDWVAGTSYPYLDNADIADSFQVAYFPTIFVICPNKKAYQIGQLNALELWEKASTCPVASGTNNAGIFDYDAGTTLREICDTLPLNPSFSLINLGSEPLTSATLTLQWNNNLEQTKQWYGNLPLYGEAVVTFDPLPLNDAGVLKTTIASINNGAGDDDFSNNVRLDNFKTAEQFNTQQIILKIKTDYFGAETYWELRDAQDSVIYKGGNANVGPNGGGTFNTPPGPGAYGNNALITKTLNLPSDGCYSLLFVDSYGDGMCCDYGNGYYKLYNSGSPAVPILTGGEFGAIDHRGFKVAGMVATFETKSDISSLQIFPNPAFGQISLEFNLETPLTGSAKVFNSLGQIVFEIAPEQLMAGKHLWMLPLSGWPPGVYFVRFQAGESAVMRKFFVGK
jgi:thiol-disulfide isomerase/thioredoxin